MGDKLCADLPNLDATAAAAKLVVRKWTPLVSILPRISLLCTTCGLVDKGRGMSDKGQPGTDDATFSFQEELATAAKQP